MVLSCVFIAPGEHSRGSGSASVNFKQRHYHLSRIDEAWTFPMYQADLSPIRVSPERLRDQQRAFSPYDDEFGDDEYYEGEVGGGEY